MNIPCPDCGGALDWSLDRVGNQPMLMSKCRHCDPAGPWQHEPVEIIRKPMGMRPKDFPPLAPVDRSEI